MYSVYIVQNTLTAITAIILTRLPALVLIADAVMDAYSPTPDFGYGFSKVGNYVGAITFAFVGLFS